jgi:type VII secretion-associated serine protease mycosin
MLSLPGRRGRIAAASAVLAAALATALAVAAGGLTLLAAAVPARADSVRSAEQWVLNAMNAQAAWPVSQGSGVTVAVIDSGVDGAIPDLSGSVTSGPDLTGVSTSPADPNWGMHGTWMASLIAGHGHGAGNASGIMGVAPMARILSVRVITDKADPGYAAYQRQPLSRGQRELAKAIRYAVRRGAGVISMSLGYGAPSRPVRAALQYAYSRNVVVVASSGNSGNAAEAAGHGSAPYSFPADYPGVLGVAAVGQDWQPASFSSDNLSVQVAGPGVNVPAAGRNSQYWLVSGTSPACALTAGVAALIRSKYPRLPGSYVIDAIARSAWHAPPGGYDRQVGFGTVNALAALTAARKFAARNPASHAVAAASHFGGGQEAVPAPPVRPRGAAAILGYSLLLAACLAAIVFCLLRLFSSRQPAGAAAGDPGAWPGWDTPPGPPAPPPAPGWGQVARTDQDADLAPGADGDDEFPGGGPQAGYSRFPWPPSPAGRHAAGSDRGGGPGGGR